jgi:PUA domain protein
VSSLYVFFFYFSPDPFMMPHMQVDKGAIRFVLSGANIMCPGLTSPGAAMTKDLPPETPVAIMAEGKEHALAVGLTKMATEKM